MQCGMKMQVVSVLLFLLAFSICSTAATGRGRGDEKQKHEKLALEPQCDHKDASCMKEAKHLQSSMIDEGKASSEPGLDSQDGAGDPSGSKSGEKELDPAADGSQEDGESGEEVLDPTADANEEDGAFGEEVLDPTTDGSQEVVAGQSSGSTSGESHQPPADGSEQIQDPTADANEEVVAGQSSGSTSGERHQPPADGSEQIQNPTADANEEASTAAVGSEKAAATTATTAKPSGKKEKSNALRCGVHLAYSVLLASLLISS